MESGMISVNKWISDGQTYFLTHLHADHSARLFCTSPRGIPFCSRLTAKLFPYKFPDFGTWRLLCLTALPSGSVPSVQVKAIDSRHYPATASDNLNIGDFEVACGVGSSARCRMRK